jgi:hypothetical protein
MIGKPITGASFHDCLEYCLEDKLGLSDEIKLKKSLSENVQHINRAEILDYNNCFGSLKDLTRQMVNVSKLNRRVEKPVFHFTLRPAEGDILTKEQFADIGHQCAREFGLENNQYVIILHKDTKQPHIHIVANRVNFDGKVVSDSYSARRMQAFCRKIEQEFYLKQVLSARPFLPKEQRQLPRHDTRKEKLKTDIQHTLEKVNTYQQFEEKMKSLGYAVLKGRGICFIDDKKVRIKGSEVGFPLAKIERVFRLKNEISQKEDVLYAKEKIWRTEQQNRQPNLTPTHRLFKKIRERDQEEERTILMEDIELLKEISTGIIAELLKPVYADQSLDPAWLQEYKKRKRKRIRHSQRL